MMEVKHHLTHAASLIPQIKVQIVAKNGTEVHTLLAQVQDHTSAARDAVNDPLWKISSHLPLIGQNFTAVSEVAQAADSVAVEAGGPLLETIDLLALGALTPVDGTINLEALQEVHPGIVSAALATERAASQLAAIDRRDLLPEIAGPLDEITQTLENSTDPLKVAAEILGMLPSMLGAAEPRNYLILVQNNAEVRATGGLPGALAVVRIENGKIDLTTQASGSELGKFIPPVAIDPEQERIFGSKLGSYISDVNLTPDFPSVARTAKAMWEVRYGTAIDGVVAIDPTVLSHILAVSGPLPLHLAIEPGTSRNLPSTLTAENVVKTLLSDVYTTMDNRGQDQYFASAAQQVFEALSAGKVPLTQLAQALAQSSEENRLHVWSQRDEEQLVLEAIRLGGSISSGPDAGPNSFGAFFNDGTGAKMDYHVKRTVQLIEECPKNGYGLTSVRITSTNTAPADAATSLPTYVTGAGVFGIPPGTVQTNILAYGPAQANVETAKIDGARTDFAPYRHSDRPVAVVTTRLAPGESRTVEFLFGKIGQQSEPNVVVTPTVEKVKDVILPTLNVDCD